VHPLWELPSMKRCQPIGASSLISWLDAGTDALRTKKSKPTTDLGWLTPSTPDYEYSRVVLHKFSHGVGCIYEHRPCSVFKALVRPHRISWTISMQSSIYRVGDDMQNAPLRKGSSE
jgi:hypothetical protein